MLRQEGHHVLQLSYRCLQKIGANSGVGVRHKQLVPLVDDTAQRIGLCICYGSALTGMHIVGPHS